MHLSFKGSHQIHPEPIGATRNRLRSISVSVHAAYRHLSPDRPGLRKTCDWLTTQLLISDMDAACYHAGKPTEERKRTLNMWLENEVEIMVATIAFGMGIDKPNVRYGPFSLADLQGRASFSWVVHWDVASSLEGFYQESGR